jgi:hypothetical protein
MSVLASGLRFVLTVINTLETEGSPLRLRVRFVGVPLTAAVAFAVAILDTFLGGITFGYGFIY